VPTERDLKDKPWLEVEDDLTCGSHMYVIEER
jgi:hypothetical protein